MNINKINKLTRYSLVGDSLLLPYEFLNKKLAITRLVKRGLKQNLFFNYGFTSDDSDHMLMTLRSLQKESDVKLFKKSLAKQLKLWFLTMPSGIGMTTIKSCIKLWLGFNNSGIHSLGNGPLMRVPIIALYYAHDKNLRDNFITASTTLTHNHSEAVAVSIAVGNLISYLNAQNNLPDKNKLNTLLSIQNSSLWNNYVEKLINGLDLEQDEFLKLISSEQFVSGYIMTSSIYSIYCLYKNDTLENAFKSIIEASGDTDTIGFLVASYFSLLTNQDMPEFGKIFLYPNNCDLLENFWVKTIIKNIFLFPVVFIVGTSRLLKIV